jgi:hypothetical protein
MTNPTGVNLINLSGVNLLTLFCKLNHWFNAAIIFMCCERHSFKKRVRKFTQKSFMRSAPVGFVIRILSILCQTKFSLVKSILQRLIFIYDSQLAILS